MREGGILRLSHTIAEDLKEKLPNQRKTQRENLALLVGTMLSVKSPNTVDLAASLPRKADRLDMRYQWVSRFLSNSHIVPEDIMRPYAKEVLERLTSSGASLVLIMDQSKVASGHEVLMVSVRLRERAIPLMWRVVKTQGEIGYEIQKELLDVVQSFIPSKAKVVLMGDRFYGTPDLINYCAAQGWDYRLRLKNNLLVEEKDQGEITTGELARLHTKFVENVFLTKQKVKTNIGFAWESGHPEPWIIAMGAKPSFYKTMDYGMRWGTENLFSDLKSRGFRLEDSQLKHASRLECLLLIMALALYWAVSTGVWDEVHNPFPYEKKVQIRGLKKLLDG